MHGLFIRSGFIGLLLIAVSLPLSAQARGTGARGTAGARGDAGQNARGARGNSDEIAAKRSEIQAHQKAAITQENKDFQNVMNRLQSERKTSTSDVERDLLKARTAAAQREHQATLQRIRAEAQSALAALK